MCPATPAGTHRSLSLPLLRGLHRLLEQMSDWFNLTLGEKLLDHLRKWADPETYLTGQVGRLLLCCSTCCWTNSRTRCCAHIDVHQHHSLTLGTSC